MAGDNKEDSGMSKGMIMKMIEFLLALFGVKMGKGGGMPLDQAIKQPGAENQAVNMLEDKMTQWACKQALKFPALREIAKDYLNDNPGVNEFAQKVLDNPKLQDFKKDLQDKGFLDDIGLNAQKNASQSDKKADVNVPKATDEVNASNNETKDSPLEMSAPKSSSTMENVIASVDYQLPEQSKEQNSEPQQENSNQMRPS